MKIAVVLGSFSIGNRPIDFEHVWDSPRGLTGTDLAFIRVSEELAKMGHQVFQFHNVSKLNADNSFDAIICFNEPNLLIGQPKSTFKVVYMMLNDFSFIEPGFKEHVDLFVGVCQQHADYVARNSGTVGKWSVVPLGCDPDRYTDKRVPGRVIWCSSADRGLHWLLQEWHKVKREIPEASLKVFYHFNYDGIYHVEPGMISPQGIAYHPHIIELAKRVRYIKHAVSELKHLGVEHVGSVSRDRMLQEFSEATAFGFSCDTVAFSEGFSVSTLEACASYTVPVITSQDCLGGIYKDSGCLLVPAPVRDNLSEYTDTLTSVLRDHKLADRVISKTRAFAERHTWNNTALQLVKLIKERK